MYGLAYPSGCDVKRCGGEGLLDEVDRSTSVTTIHRGHSDGHCDLVVSFVRSGNGLSYFGFFL